MFKYHNNYFLYVLYSSSFAPSSKLSLAVNLGRAPLLSSSLTRHWGTSCWNTREVCIRSSSFPLLSFSLWNDDTEYFVRDSDSHSSVYSITADVTSKLDDRNFLIEQFNRTAFYSIFNPYRIASCLQLFLFWLQMFKLRNSIQRKTRYVKQGRSRYDARSTDMFT